MRVHLCDQPVDMRKSYDVLYALTRNTTLHQGPLSGPTSKTRSEYLA